MLRHPHSFGLLTALQNGFGVVSPDPSLVPSTLSWGLTNTTLTTTVVAKGVTYKADYSAISAMSYASPLIFHAIITGVATKQLQFCEHCTIPGIPLISPGEAANDQAGQIGGKGVRGEIFMFIRGWARQGLQHEVLLWRLLNPQVLVSPWGIGRVALSIM